MNTSRRALARLQEEDGEAIRELARLMADEALSTPLRDVARPQWLASQIAAALEVLVGSDVARAALQERYDAAVAVWMADERLLEDLVPVEALGPLREALRRPFVPSEEIVWRLLDQDVFRSLMSDVLAGSLKRFRGRMSMVDDKIFGGLGRRAARRGRGMFGGVAEGLVGAVSDEVESQFERRLAEFLGGATGEAMRFIARHMSDPSHADAYADLRISVLETLLETDVSALAAEVRGVAPMAYADLLGDALRAELAREGFVGRLTDGLTRWMAEVGDGTLGAWLDEVGLRDVWTISTTDLVADHLGALVQTNAFEGWWASLFRADGTA